MHKNTSELCIITIIIKLLNESTYAALWEIKTHLHINMCYFSCFAHSEMSKCQM